MVSLTYNQTINTQSINISNTWYFLKLKTKPGSFLTVWRVNTVVLSLMQTLQPNTKQNGNSSTHCTRTGRQPPNLNNQMSRRKLQRNIKEQPYHRPSWITVIYTSDRFVDHFPKTRNTNSVEKIHVWLNSMFRISFKTPVYYAIFRSEER